MLVSHSQTTTRSHSLLQIIRLSNPPLHRRPLGNPIDPLQQMRELIHILLRERRVPVPALDPRPSLHIGNAILALALARKVVFGVAAVFAAEVDFEHAEDAQGFVFEAVDGVFDLLGGGACEVVYLALVSVLC